MLKRTTRGKGVSDCVLRGFFLRGILFSSLWLLCLSQVLEYRCVSYWPTSANLLKFIDESAGCLWGELQRDGQTLVRESDISVVLHPAKEGPCFGIRRRHSGDWSGYWRLIARKNSLEQLLFIRVPEPFFWETIDSVTCHQERRLSQLAFDSWWKVGLFQVGKAACTEAGTLPPTLYRVPEGYCW